MNRKEAETLIGKPVRAWTAANGVYVGELEQVLGRPWRGTVRITGVVEPACVYDLTRSPRRGFRPGETIVIGGINIKPISEDEPATSYLEALDRELNKFKHYEQQYSSNPASVGKLGPLLPKLIPRIEQAIAQEAKRLAREREERAPLARPEPPSHGRIGGIEI